MVKPESKDSFKVIEILFYNVSICLKNHIQHFDEGGLEIEII